MLFKVVLVEPETPGNVGFICRAAKNFGLKAEDLWLVGPEIDYLNGEARSRAMHAVDYLGKLRVFGSMSEALKEVDYSVATTCAKSKERSLVKKSLPLKEFAEKHSGSEKAYGLFFGREGNGLNNDEISACDFVVNIPSSREYPSMNLSHAVTVFLYELYQHKINPRFEGAGRDLLSEIRGQAEEILGKGKGLRNKEGIILALNGFLSRSAVTRKEARAFLSLLKEAKRNK